MALASSELREYTEVAERMGHDTWLGRIFFYSLSGVRILHRDVIQNLAAAGILTNLPHEPTDVDVFKRVATKVKRTKVPVAGSPELHQNWIAREFRDDATVTRRIVRELVDNKGRKLKFDEVVDIIFDRKTGDLGANFLRTDPVAEQMVDEVRNAYAAWRGSLNSWACREWIRQYVVNLGSVRVRPSGGLYFLKEAHAGKLDALQQFVDSLPGSCEFHSLPLLDDRRQREFVQRAFEAESTGAVDELLVEMGEIMSSDKQISEDKFHRYVDQYTELSERTHEYANLLEEKLDATGARLSIFQKTLLQLRLSVKD